MRTSYALAKNVRRIASTQSGIAMAILKLAWAFARYALLAGVRRVCTTFTTPPASWAARITLIQVSLRGFIIGGRRT